MKAEKHFPGGSFIYIAGPVTKARIYTAPFQLTTHINLLFHYYKTSNDAKLWAIVRMNETPSETIVFTVLHLHLKILMINITSRNV